MVCKISKSWFYIFPRCGNRHYYGLHGKAFPLHLHYVLYEPSESMGAN